ncbi:MAG TPA: hypothetical protein PLJ47_05790 [Candidatus Hydrogenedentes bacterium]|nr:hypothetical protein [Candidatus Hydrogenedentota bacterium]
MAKIVYQKKLLPHRYDFHDWVCSTARAEVMVYRPSGRTLLRRLGIMTIVLVLLALIGFQVVPSFMAVPAPNVSNESTLETKQEMDALASDLLSTLSPADRQNFEERLAQTNAARNAQIAEYRETRERINKFVLYGCAGIGIPIAIAALMSPLSCLWQRIEFTHTGSRRFNVRKRGALARSVEISAEEFPHLRVRVVERISRQRRRTVYRDGYDWIVSMEADATRPGTINGVPIFEFVVHHQKDRPVPEMPMPPRVRALVEFLERITARKAGQTVFMDYQGVQGPWYAQRHVVSGQVSSRMIGEPTVTEASISLDEMSPEMRAQFAPLMEKARTAGPMSLSIEGSSSDQAITFRDENGNVRRYSSIDEMPSDVRALFEQVRKLRG